MGLDCRFEIPTGLIEKPAKPPFNRKASKPPLIEKA